MCHNERRNLQQWSAGPHHIADGQRVNPPNLSSGEFTELALRRCEIIK
jgi:hypothetical protein